MSYILIPLNSHLQLKVIISLYSYCYFIHNAISMIIDQGRLYCSIQCSHELPRLIEGKHYISQKADNN